MSIERDPEQPAFPRSYVADGHNGMTLRDWFAGQALVGMMQAMRPYSDRPRQCAVDAYLQADAMMAARLAPLAEQKDRTNG